MKTSTTQYLINKLHEIKNLNKEDKETILKSVEKLADLQNKINSKKYI